VVDAEPTQLEPMMRIYLRMSLRVSQNQFSEVGTGVGGIQQARSLRLVLQQISQQLSHSIEILLARKEMERVMVART
jgi:hypothetical protein